MHKLSPRQRSRLVRRAGRLSCALFVALGACATMPPSFADLTWVDKWGERGRGVLERDFVMCARLVESKRSQLADCMSSRGWSIQQ
jgi:hypothetical protein